jgi:hypothetical protein
MKEDPFHQGRWLRKSVAEMGVSVSSFARRARVSRDALNKWFSQKHVQWRIDSAVRVLGALGYDVNALMGEGRVEYALKEGKGGDIFGAIVAAQGSQTLIHRAMSPLYGGAQRLRRGQPLQVLQLTPQELDPNVEPYSEEQVPPVPEFELAVAAGHWTDVSDIAEVHQPGQIDHGFFRVRIRGDSMSPKYKDGAMIEFRCLRADRDGVIVGRDYYVQRSDGTATFKCVEEADEETLTLRARNQRKYPERMVVERGLVVRMALAINQIQSIQ